MTTLFRKFSWLIVALAFVATSPSLHACAACFGKSDSNLAKGMNMGIFALLGVIVTVLGGIASFFVFLARRSTEQTASQTLPELTKQTS
jgi:hypothetical protein